MPCLVTTTALYPGDPDDLFRQAIDFTDMLEAMSGVAAYKGLPSEPVREGATYTTDVTFFGFLKTSGHVIEIEKLDLANRTLQSREYNPAIRQWDHLLTVEPETGTGPARARWTDAVTIDAGWRTPVITRFASFVYRRRHQHRQALEIQTSLRSLA